MTPKQFANWVVQVYDTRENEWDCQQTQSLLPTYVEAEFHGYLFAESANLEVHLRQCLTCLETFKVLYDLVETEVEHGELPPVSLETTTLPIIHPISPPTELLPVSAD